jgi:hypothetical protein
MHFLTLPLPFLFFSVADEVFEDALELDLEVRLSRLNRLPFRFCISFLIPHRSCLVVRFRLNHIMQNVEVMRAGANEGREKENVEEDVEDPEVLRSADTLAPPSGDMGDLGLGLEATPQEKGAMVQEEPSQWADVSDFYDDAEEEGGGMEMPFEELLIGGETPGGAPGLEGLTPGVVTLLPGLTPGNELVVVGDTPEIEVGAVEVRGRLSFKPPPHPKTGFQTPSLFLSIYIFIYISLSLSPSLPPHPSLSQPPLHGRCFLSSYRKRTMTHLRRCLASTGPKLTGRWIAVTLS